MSYHIMQCLQKYDNILRPLKDLHWLKKSTKGQFKVGYTHGQVHVGHNSLISGGPGDNFTQLHPSGQPLWDCYPPSDVPHPCVTRGPSALWVQRLWNSSSEVIYAIQTL